MMIELTFVEGFAIAAGFVQAFAAGVFLRFRRARPQWGLGWLAFTFGAAALINLAAPVLPYGSSTSLLSITKLVSMALGIGVMGALVAGIRLYTAHPRPGPWLVFSLTVLAYVVVVLWAAAAPRTAALQSNLLTGALFAYLGGLSWRASRREPGAGHLAVALMLFQYIPMVLAGYWFGLDQVTLRYWSSIPFALAGLGIMSATMGRLHVELQDLNETLENRVMDRTKELNDIIASLESFNGMVSHDLKGPLGGMVGLSNVALAALDAGDTERARRLFTAIRHESANLAELVSDMLALARATHAEPVRQAVPLDELVQESLNFLEVTHGEGAGRCVCHHDLPQVHADRGLLRQVLVNLLGNALKFSSHAQHPCVKVVSQQVGQTLRVSVQDNGIGFDPEKSATLFQPFQRLHGGAGYEGTGLGLAIVRRIVERHGGQVGADSQPGQGATFWFTLPC